jgi:hypothetical protein
VAKAPTDIRSLARAHTAAAIASLAGIATNGESEAAKVSACIALLDRGWGKPAQVIAGDEDGGPLQVVVKQFVLADN